MYGDVAIDEEDAWSIFTCPTQPLLTFSVVSPGLPFPPVQVCHFYQFALCEISCRCFQHNLETISFTIAGCYSLMCYTNVGIDIELPSN